VNRQILGLALAVLTAPAAAAESCSATSPEHVVPLVELYTAEGCSDCPPADKWLSRLAADGAPTRAIPLALHVDYWNEAGWPDRFSDAAYTKRQDFRLHLAKKKVRYTPQVMVGADTSVNWRDESEVNRVIARAAKTPAKVSLSLRAQPANGKLQVAVQAIPQPGLEVGQSPNLLWLAMYENGLISEISEGENKGRTLHHDRVTRVLQGPWGLDTKTVDGNVEIPLPAGAAESGRYGLVVFAESSTTGAGLQSLELPLSGCLK
jgi:hypothetical protein